MRPIFILSALSILLLSGSVAAASENKEIKIASSTLCSAVELEENTQVLIKYRPPNLSNGDISAIFRAIASQIKTFDGKNTIKSGDIEI